MRITSISDAIVVSIPERATFCGRRKGKIFGLRVLIETVLWIQRELVQLGILTRGGISAGLLHHSDSVVIGPGLVQAYELERDAAHYPRVVVDEKLLPTILRGVDHNAPRSEDMMLLLRKLMADGSRAILMTQIDDDRMVYVDYLGSNFFGPLESDWTRRLHQIKKSVAKDLERASSIRIRHKLHWLIGYIEKKLGENAKDH
jgi:hypothetical protein